ncbi:hypothetical protein [Paenibacillus luteus]|uniref:hypothetical protein n=1 Tax=Paenibacillus luteus TaxID=2545753 RepID=UPI001142DACB|nr:hypothetical protein [Paenibacillus luteus]
MSIPLLRELHEDVRRLSIAGASMAIDDLRLNRIQPQLVQLGEKAPIFKRVAEEVAGLTKAQPEHAAGKLLDLAVLLQAVLHTQSTTEAPGELSALGSSTSVVASTNIPYRKLKPLMDALTQRGPGRLEMITQGKTDGAFADLRTALPAVHALRDSYSEIADYVAEHVIPIVGKAVLPMLQQQFDRDGASGDARILTTLYKLTDNREELWPLLSSVSKEAALPVRLAAIALMADLPHFEEELLDLSYARKKEVRGAALAALSHLSSSKIDDRFMEALMGKDAELSIGPIQNYESAALTLQLLHYGQALIDKNVPSVKDVELREKLGSVIQCLETRAEDGSVISFLMAALENNHLEFKGTESLTSEAAAILLHSNDINALTFMHEQRSEKEYFVGYSFKAALRIYDAAQVYELYESYFKTKKGKYMSDLLQTVYQYSHNPLIDILFEGRSRQDLAWDERWVDRFIELNEEELVCRLATKPDKKVIAYLVEKSKVAPQLLKQRTIHLFYALFRLGHRDTPDMVIDALELAAQKSFHYLDREAQVVIAMLPSSYAERIQQIADKVTYEYAKNQLKQLAEQLAAKPEEINEKQEGAGFLSWIKNKIY